MYRSLARHLLLLVVYRFSGTKNMGARLGLGNREQ
jgi:hypothetical protein